MNTDPTAIRLDVGANRLSVTWSDGHESTFAGSYLRFRCPCAGCRGHAPGQVPPPTWAACADVRVQGAGAVGAYAIRFDFSDAHDTGIYSFEWLRAHCPSLDPDVDAEGRPLDRA